MSLLEKEIKVLHIDLISLIVNLEKIGAQRVNMGSVCDHYYDLPDDSLQQTSSKRIRIRYQKWWNKLTMKKRIPSNSMKIAHENEFTIDNYHSVKVLLWEYGLVPKWQKYKTRMTYVFGDIQYDIDLYPWIPPLVEIEAMSEEKVRYWIEIAWLGNYKTSTSGAVWLMKRYGKTPVPLHE